MNLIHFINGDNIIDTQMWIAAGTIDNTVEPIYDHHTWMKDCVRPLQKWDDYRVISVFWEIGGIKSYCLIDSGCEGIMISPEFTRAVKIKTFALEKPIGIQLAVMGSKSVMNYGTNYYDAILGTLFLKKYKVIINFLQNCLKIEDKTIYNQAGNFKMTGNSPWPHTSFKSLKPEKLPASPKDSHWLSLGLSTNKGGIYGEHVLKIENIKTAECPSQESLGLKKPMSEYTLEDILRLCVEIAELFSDLLEPLSLELLPLCEVLHKIPLIDESKKLKHRLPKCPEAFYPELTWKIEWYTTAGWWIPAADKQAMPMLCILKKNGTLCTVFDLQQENNNT